MSRNIEEELKNWDYLFSGIEDQEGIEGEERGEIINNWKQLRDNLGEYWLKNKKNDYHPLRIYLFNRAPWSIRWVSELGLGISLLKKKKILTTFLRGFFQSRSFVALIMNYGWLYHC